MGVSKRLSCAKSSSQSFSLSYRTNVGQATKRYFLCGAAAKSPTNQRIHSRAAAKKRRVCVSLVIISSHTLWTLFIIMQKALNHAAADGFSIYWRSFVIIVL